MKIGRRLACTVATIGLAVGAFTMSAPSGWPQLDGSRVTDAVCQSDWTSSGDVCRAQ